MEEEKIKNKEKFKNTKQRGITLIALVITIIVLLILAGVSIAMLTGENGILTQAQEAKKQTSIAEEKEQIALAYNAVKAQEKGGTVTADKLDAELQKDGANAEDDAKGIKVTFEESGREYIIDENGNITEGTGVTTPPEEPENQGTLGTITGDEETPTEVKDSLDNKVVVPPGFTIQNPTANVEDGIVIVDKNHGATAGSEFVWIPVGTIHTSNGDKIITLGRYSFDSTTGEPSAYSGSYTEDTVAEHTYDNTPAKDIEGFKTSVEANGGYYLGRYEARTATERTAETDPLTQITTKPNEYVYNYVTQLQAAEQSQNMYTSEYFESDLVNSYAWDTAIVFLQECDNRENKGTSYSIQTSLNSSLAEKGTNGTGTEDVICNIYDMASNCYERSTETCFDAGMPCAFRGGYYGNSFFCTSDRGGSYTTYSTIDYSFRPLLYL